MHLDKATLKEEAEFFWQNGYMVIRNAFSPEEMGFVKSAIKQNKMMEERVEALRKKVADGKHPSFETIFVWNDTSGDDIFAKVTRNYKIIERLEYFFSDSVYVYHNKIALKYPGIPGFRYHQDYNYWYKMGNLYPDMATASTAIDAATIENGCLRILEGSHKMGRIDHEFHEAEHDSGVNEARLNIIRQRLKEVHIKLDVGDTVIFHCNTLHASDDNHSPASRIALLGCYNTKHNSPYSSKESGHPYYSEQKTVTEKITAADIARMPDFSLAYA